MADIRDMTDQQLEAEYGAEWWERATWRCDDCGEDYTLSEMYGMGGECEVCGNKPTLFSVRPGPDARIPF